MRLRIISVITICLSLIACNKPDPNPELKDPIYQDYNSSMAAASQALEAERKALEGFEKELKEVVPQTGQIKYAQKRVNESKEKITRIEQERQYYELKIESRKREAKMSYLKAFKKGEPWPDPKEWEIYQQEKKLRTAKRVWDVNERIKEAGLANGGGGKEKAPGEAAEGHH